MIAKSVLERKPDGIHSLRFQHETIGLILAIMCTCQQLNNGDRPHLVQKEDSVVL